MKSSGINRRIELAANVVIVLAGVFLGCRLFFPKLLSHDARNVPDTISLGTKFALGPADSTSHAMTLVLALRQGCRFCAESASFYKRLTQLAGDSKRLHLMVVLPQDPSQGRKYLKDLDIDIGDVQRGEFAALNIAYTPTLLLLDRKGSVRRIWVGKLSERRESEVLQELGF
jgi:hypothetical protein